MKLDNAVARDIITALRRGTVPATGLHHFVVGLELEQQVIGEELDYTASGRAAIKCVNGDYGAGKSFLSRLAMAMAAERGLVCSFVTVSVDTPLDKLDVVYRDLAANLRITGQQAALKGLVDRWVYRVEEKLIDMEGIGEDDPALRDRTREEIEQTLSRIPALPSAFVAALSGYYLAQYDEDFPTANGILGWLAGETTVAAGIKRQAGLTGRVDPTMSLSFVRGIAEVARLSGSTGLMVAFDEVETIQRLTRPSREKALNNLRQIVDDCDAGSFPYCYFLFTGTPDFFDGSKGIKSLDPLYDRLKLTGDREHPNLRQTQIVLRKFDREKLLLVAQKVRTMFQVAHPDPPLDPERTSDAVIEAMADRVTGKLGGRVDVVPRLFLRELIDVLDRVQEYPDYDPREHYKLDLESVTSAMELAPQEEEALRGGEGFEEAPTIE